MPPVVKLPGQRIVAALPQGNGLSACVKIRDARTVAVVVIFSADHCVTHTRHDRFALQVQVALLRDLLFAVQLAFHHRVSAGQRLRLAVAVVIGFYIALAVFAVFLMGICVPAPPQRQGAVCRFIAGGNDGLSVFIEGMNAPRVSLDGFRHAAAQIEVYRLFLLPVVVVSVTDFMVSVRGNDGRIPFIIITFALAETHQVGIAHLAVAVDDLNTVHVPVQVYSGNELPRIVLIVQHGGISFVQQHRFSFRVAPDRQDLPAVALVGNLRIAELRHGHLPIGMPVHFRRELRVPVVRLQVPGILHAAVSVRAVCLIVLCVVIRRRREIGLPLERVLHRVISQFRGDHRLVVLVVIARFLHRAVDGVGVGRPAVSFPDHHAVAFSVEESLVAALSRAEIIVPIRAEAFRHFRRIARFVKIADHDADVRFFVPWRFPVQPLALIGHGRIL